MTENEALLIRNLLNGVAPETATRAAELSEEEGLAVFSEAMKRVAEYRVVHCLPFFECGTLAAARQNCHLVLKALEEIGRWDDEGRELMIALFKGQRPDRKEAEMRPILARTLDAMPFYLEKNELPAWRRDRQAFIRERRSRVIDLLERFVSFRTPLLYKRIEHQITRISD